jgi:hypothetical protein
MTEPKPSEPNECPNINWDAPFLGSGCPLIKNLQERFARKTGDDPASRVAHAHDLLPIFRRGGRRDRWADGNGDASGARKPGAVPQRAPRSCQSDGHDLPLRRDGRLERAEMKWTNAGLRAEGSLWKNKNGFAAPEGALNLFRLLQPRVRVFAAKREMAELAKKRPEKRHGHNFGLRDEMVIRAQRRHEHDDIRVARMICDEHTWSVFPQMLAAVDAHAPAGNSQVRAQRRRRNLCRAFSGW